MMRNILISLILMVFVLMIGSCASNPLLAQEQFATDNDLLLERFDKNHGDGKSPTSLLLPRSDRLVARYNPVTLTFSGMMFVYQRYLSPQLPSECLYHPSCSSFSKSLIREYGLIKGIVATADRLIRCNRVASIDIHPMLIDEQRGKVTEHPDLYRKGKQ